MTGAEVDRLEERPAAASPGYVSQATLVEQSRAVAEVEGMIVVAQRVPRNIDRVSADMQHATGRMHLARMAFYSVKNRGSGSSVHLARELARIWGNVDFGVRETFRDDQAGRSEVQAYAWDLQANSRTVRSFIVPHARMVTPAGGGKAKPEPLTDLGDVYRNNQNIGARAVRECIWAVLPGWFVDEAEQRCRATLTKGEDQGEPLPDRIANVVAKFAAEGVRREQLEARIGRRRGTWDGADLADMTIVYYSIRRGETTVRDEFPPADVREALANPDVDGPLVPRGVPLPESGPRK